MRTYRQPQYATAPSERGRQVRYLMLLLLLSVML